MAQLQLILDRIIDENLHGPISTTTNSAVTSHQRLLRSPGSQPELFSDQELDAEDPRQIHSENENLDPVFVKRKPTSNNLPPLDDAVLWRETFFLNLIVQLPCKLTVAVCTRTPNDNSNGPNQKTSMTCSNKHVSKRVYALPTQSRMDDKETSMECSYPLIHYVIDDYEDMFEHLIVTDGEYLCVELAVTIPNKSDDDDDLSDRDNDSDDDYYGTSANISSRSSNKFRRSMTNGPFPQPSNDSKITLFQGAASYSSLLEIYKQKAANKLNKRFKMGPVTPPTEYIMMRGPGGKGNAQVAITASSLDEANEDITTSESNFVSSINANSSGSEVDPCNFNSGNNTNPINNGKTTIRNSQRSTSSSSFFQSLKRLSQSITDKSSSDPESLKCCMTFVNVNWTSIITDLLTYAGKKQS